MIQAGNCTHRYASMTFSMMIARYWWYSAKRGTSHMVARERFAASSESGRVPFSSNRVVS